MMNNYAESKKTLDRIRNEYGCKGDIIFRTAMQYVVDCGQQIFSDDDWVKTQLKGSEFENAIIKCATEIAKVNTYDLLIYIQKEVYWSNEGGLDYQRAIELLHSCMNWFIDYDCCETKEMLERFEDLDFTDDELETLGLGWLFDTEEDENND